MAAGLKIPTKPHESLRDEKRRFIRIKAFGLYAHVGGPPGVRHSISCGCASRNIPSSFARSDFGRWSARLASMNNDCVIGPRTLLIPCTGRGPCRSRSPCLASVSWDSVFYRTRFALFPAINGDLAYDDVGVASSCGQRCHLKRCTNASYCSLNLSGLILLSLSRF